MRHDLIAVGSHNCANI